jgi:hypothetical protein
MEPPPTINLQDERGAAVLRPTSLQEWTTEPPAAKSEKRGRRAATNAMRFSLPYDKKRKRKGDWAA